MATCDLTSGFALGCKDNMGGISAVYIANKASIDTVTEATGEISAITMEATKTFYAFYLNKNSGSFSEPIQGNPTNGTTVYEPTVTMQFSKMEASKRNTIKILAQADLVAIVKDNNGKYWYLGKEGGLDLVEGNGGSGTAKADLNGYTLTLRGQEKEPAFEVDSAVITTTLVSGL